MKKVLIKMFAVVLCLVSVSFVFSACANHKVIGVKLSRTQVFLEVGEDTLITATVLPKEARNKKVSWSSSDPSVVTVDNGRLCAVSCGEATVTVQTEHTDKDELKFRATCTVVVVEPIEYVVKYQMYSIVRGQTIFVTTGTGATKIDDKTLTSTSKVSEFIPKSTTIKLVDADSDEYYFYGWTINKKKFDGSKYAYNNENKDLTIYEFLQQLEQGNATEKAIRNQIIETRVITVVASSSAHWSGSH